MSYDFDYNKNILPADFTLLSYELRAVAHVLRYADYIYSVTDDVHFPSAIINVCSDYLYHVSESCEVASNLVTRKADVNGCSD